MNKIKWLLQKLFTTGSLKFLFFSGAAIIVAAISTIILVTKYSDTKTESLTVRIIELSMNAEPSYEAKLNFSEMKYYIESYLNSQTPEELKEAMTNFDKYSKFVIDITAGNPLLKKETSEDFKKILEQLKSLLNKVKNLNPKATTKEKDALAANFLDLSKQNEKLLEVYSNTLFDKKIEAIEELNETRSKLKTLNLSISIGTIILSVIALFFMFIRIRPLNNIIHRLNDQAQTVSSASDSILGTAENLKKSSESQSSAAVETAASVEEINEMATRTAESATQLMKNVQNGTNAIAAGLTMIDEMLLVMKQIESNGQDISVEVTNSNNQIQEIVTVISDIAEKTKLINDIVFQTKLLSFNASVEAARAGDAGKGFAVVAQEIGNLAQMSGHSAQEISSTLSVGINKVEHIIANSKKKLDELSAAGKEKIKDGSAKANSCGQSFEIVSDQMEQVQLASTNINQSIQEQVRGLSEIRSAMSVFDTSSTHNLTSAEKTFDESSELKDQSIELERIVIELRNIANGNS
jgi:methyl-accepting chemotaxis protein